jgi:hypothetical protein
MFYSSIRRDLFLSLSWLQQDENEQEQRDEKEKVASVALNLRRRQVESNGEQQPAHVENEDA